MVVVHLAVEQPLHGVDDPAAADECAVDIVAQLVANRQPDDSAGAVATARRIARKLSIGPGDLAQQVDLNAVEKALDDQVTVALELVALRVTQNEGHGRSLGESFDTALPVVPAEIGSAAAGRITPTY